MTVEVGSTGEFGARGSVLQNDRNIFMLVPERALLAQPRPPSSKRQHDWSLQASRFPLIKDGNSRVCVRWYVEVVARS